MSNQNQVNAGEADLLELTRRATIAAPLAAVWGHCSDFDGVDAWLTPVDKVTVKSGGDNAPGTVRHLDIKGGGFVEEELLEHSATEHRFRYRIVAGVLPVSDYVSDFCLEAAGPDATTVTWTGHFRRQDRGPQPAEGADDTTALGAITGVYDAGLAGLKALCETR